MYLLLALAVIGALAGLHHKIYTSGYTAGEAACKAQREKDNALQREREAKQAGNAVTNLEKGDEKQKTVYRTITKRVKEYVDRPVYRAECWDADGLRDANAALLGGENPAPKPAARPVPAAQPAR